MTNAIEVPQPAELDPTMEQAKAIAKSGLVPQSLNTPEKIYVAILTGREAGLSPVAAVRSVYVINGTPAWKGEAALALIRKSGLARAVDVGSERVGDGEEEMRGFMRWVDLEGIEHEVLYSYADAKRAHLWGKKGPWSEHPKDMLMWRAVGRASKRYFSEVLLGMDVSEVAMDYAHREPGAAQAAITSVAPEHDPLLDVVDAPGETEPAEPESDVVDAEIVGPESPAHLAEPPEDWTPGEEGELF